MLAALLQGAHAQGAQLTQIQADASLSEVLPAIFKLAPAALMQQLRFDFDAATGKERDNKVAQIIITADEQTMDESVQAKQVDASSRISFAANRLVLVMPANSAPFDERALRANATQGATRGRVQAHVKLALADKGAKFAIANTSHEPLSRYAKTALQALNVWDTAEPHLLQVSDSSAVLKSVEQGKAAVGMVYITQALASQQVRMAAQVPVELHPPVFYQAALSTAASAQARQALEFLKSEAAQKVLSEFGFRPL